MQVDGKCILVDPVLSGNTSPIRFTTTSYKGSDVYIPADFPAIDYLLITHDHWDHLDHSTVLKLKLKIKKIITGLGTGAHLEHWGFDTNDIIEKNWNETIQLDNGFIVNTTPGRHFSGRGLKRNLSLWMSFVLTTPTMKIFIGGDSGYDTHFKTIGNAYGPFDVAILECGQYNPYRKYIHLMPEEVVQTGIDLQTKNCCLYIGLNSRYPCMPGMSLWQGLQQKQIKKISRWLRQWLAKQSTWKTYLHLLPGRKILIETRQSPVIVRLYSLFLFYLYEK